MGRLARGSASQRAMFSQNDNSVEEELEGTWVETRRPIRQLMTGSGFSALTAPWKVSALSPQGRVTIRDFALFITVFSVWY